MLHSHSEENPRLRYSINNTSQTDTPSLTRVQAPITEPHTAKNCKGPTQILSQSREHRRARVYTSRLTHRVIRQRQPPR